MEDLLSGEEAKKKSDKVTSSQSLPNLAFIDTNEVMNDLHCNSSDDAIRIQSNNEAMFLGCYHCQVHHQDWPQLHPTADNIMDPNATASVDVEAVQDFHVVMDEEQDPKGHDKGQRPLLVGSFLMGIGLSCIFLVNPAMMITNADVTETRSHHLMALLCIMATLASPALAFANIFKMLSFSLLVLIAFVICHILGWTLLSYLALGPFLAFLQWGQFSLLAFRSLAWLQAAKALPHLLVALVLFAFCKTANGFTSILTLNLIFLVLAGLCQCVHFGIATTAPEPEEKQSKKMTNERKKSLLAFYLKDNQLHMLLPMAFFVGLFEAFMAKEFITISVRTLLGMDKICVILGILGISRLISTWLTSQLRHIISSSILLVVLSLFQLALLLLQWLWRPSEDDPLVFWAITFVWGTTAAAWDFLILGPYGIGRYREDPQDWKCTVALLSLHQFAGMAVTYGLPIDASLLAAAFIVTLIPFWCYLKQ